MSPITEPPAERMGPGLVANENTAPHVGPAFDSVRLISRLAVLDRSGPHHLAHFSGSVFDFDVDVLGVGKAVSTPPDRVRSGCRHLGRQLSVAVSDLDQTLQRVASGALIRTVLHTDQGACYCNCVVPGQYFVAVVFDQPAATRDAPLSLQPVVRACDQAVSELVTAQRAQLSLGSQNPGGFVSQLRDTEEHARHAWAGARKTHIERWPSVTPADQYADADDQPAGEPVAEETVAALETAFTGAIDPADLHYVALCLQDSTVLTVDCLDDSDLSRFFTQIPVQERRTFYAEFGQSLEFVASRLARVAAAAIGPRLLRVVLDVEQGSVYYYRLELGKYLVGVTLDQAQVLVADDRMARLALTCQAVLRRRDDNPE